MSDENDQNLKTNNYVLGRRDFRLQSNEMAPFWLAALIESADDAVIGKTLDGVIASWNRGAERIFGYTANEVIGKPITILIPPGRIDEESEILARIRAGEHIEHYETVRLRKDGSLVDISLSVSPIREPGGTIIGASKIARDIGDRKRIESGLKSALLEAHLAREENERLYRETHEANRLKDEFLAALSHELRTPLTAILGWTHVLRSDQYFEGSAARAIETIERNARAQAQLIDDLLDVSRIITGKLRLDIRSIDPYSVIESAIESLRPAAEAKRIQIQKLIDPGIGSIAGDPVRLQQVMWNLLSNAVKFTPAEGIVAVKLLKTNSHIEIIVSDTGQGIAEDFLPHVFERFRQADQKTTRRHGGLGLGLAIVRHLVELHGGSVKVESGGEGLGATFTVSMLITPNEKEHDEFGSHSTAGSRCLSLESPDQIAGINVLVVDDEQDTREMLTTGLAQNGAKVLSASSVIEGINAVKTKRFDVIISDIGMPDLDGYEFIKRLRALPPDEGGRTLAIALTAYARTEDRLQVLRAGYQMHIPKPVELAELIAVVASLARR